MNIRVYIYLSWRLFITFLIFLGTYLGLGIAQIPTFVGSSIFSGVLWLMLMACLILIATLDFSYRTKREPPSWLEERKNQALRLGIVLAAMLEVSVFASGDYRVTSILPSGDPLQGTHYIEAAVAIGCWLYGSKPSENEQK
jgi:hypothetical protein